MKKYMKPRDREWAIRLLNKTDEYDPNQVFGIALELERWSHKLMANVVKHNGGYEEWENRIP